MSRVMVYDETQGWLTRAWKAGASLGGFDRVIAAQDWSEAISELRRARDEDEFRFTHVQVWGHGSSSSGPVIGNQQLNLNMFSQALSPGLQEVWFRSCDTFRGLRGMRFAQLCVDALGCDVAGHTRVISAPNPICQSGGYVLGPNEVPHWDPGDGGGSGLFRKNTCLITTMRVPMGWHQ